MTIDDVPDRPGVAARIFRAIATEGINVDMIVQNVSHEAKTDLSFTAPRADLPRLQGGAGRRSPPRSGPRASRSTTTSRRSRSSAPA